MKEIKIKISNSGQLRNINTNDNGIFNGWESYSEGGFEVVDSFAFSLMIRSSKTRGFNTTWCYSPSNTVYPEL